VPHHYNNEARRREQLIPDRQDLQQQWIVGIAATHAVGIAAGNAKGEGPGRGHVRISGVVDPEMFEQLPGLGKGLGQFGLPAYGAHLRKWNCLSSGESPAL
jgi:hypothetical protein